MFLGICAVQYCGSFKKASISLYSPFDRGDRSWLIRNTPLKTFTFIFKSVSSQLHTKLTRPSTNADEFWQWFAVLKVRNNPTRREIFDVFFKELFRHGVRALLHVWFVLEDDRWALRFSLLYFCGTRDWFGLLWSNDMGSNLLICTLHLSWGRPAELESRKEQRRGREKSQKSQALTTLA